MAKIHNHQTTMAAGELDPTLRGQSDLRAYSQGLALLRNASRRSTGGVERRYGTYDLGGLDELTRLHAFEFSDTQRYLVGTQVGEVLIFDINGDLLQTIATAPWDLTQMREMTWTQRGDVMMFAHNDWPTRLLRRTGATTFTLSEAAWEQALDGKKVYQPYFKFTEAAHTMTPSAATGSITLTSSQAYFVADHVGERIRLYDAEVEINSITDSTHAVCTVQGELVGKLDLDPLRTTAGSNVVEVVHFFHGLETGATITISGANTVGSIPGSDIDGTYVVEVVDEIRYKITLTGLSYTLYEDPDGDGVNTPVNYTGAKTSEDGGGPNVKFNAAGTETRTWLEASFSPTRGYAGACCFHEQRLWLAGTTSQPDGVFGTKTTFYFNFDVGKGYDADAVLVAAGDEDVSKIRHIISNGDLQFMTPTGEAVFLTREGEAITPNNARIKGQTRAGCNYVQPCIFDGATLFVQENGLSVTELVFSAEKGGYVPTPVSTLAGHLIRTPVDLCASQGLTARAEQMAFVVNADGTVAVFHSLRAENIAGWGLWTIGNAIVHSACAIGPHLFFSVERPDGHRLYKLASDDVVCLDGAVLHGSPSAKLDWVFDARVRDRTLGVRTNLGYHGEFAIPADGTFLFEVEVEWVVVGDPFYWTVKTLPPTIQLPDGSYTGEIQRLVRTNILFDETESATINGLSLPIRRENDDRAAPIIPFSGWHRKGHLGYSKEPSVTISQDEPLPARILSIKQKVKV